jgi:hypothetical protein
MPLGKLWPSGRGLTSEMGQKATMLGQSMAHLSAMMDSVMMVVLVVVKASRPGRDAGKGG